MIDPANRDRAIEAAREMMKASQAESGCISNDISADLSDPGRFFIFERWEDQAALDFHFATSHMATFQGLMGTLGVRGMDVQKYQIASAGPVF